MEPRHLKKRLNETFPPVKKKQSEEEQPYQKLLTVVPQGFYPLLHQGATMPPQGFTVTPPAFYNNVNQTPQSELPLPLPFILPNAYPRYQVFTPITTLYASPPQYFPRPVVVSSSLPPSTTPRYIPNIPNLNVRYNFSQEEVQNITQKRQRLDQKVPFREDYVIHQKDADIVIAGEEIEDCKISDREKKNITVAPSSSSSSVPSNTVNTIAQEQITASERYREDVPPSSNRFIFHQRKARKKRSKSKINGQTFNGEERLFISFDNLGNIPDTIVDTPKVGKNKGVIPDGLRGCFKMYGEGWEFTVRYIKEAICQDGKRRVLIEWGIKNLDNEILHVLSETDADAFKREERGITLCNKVFVEALKIRVNDYLQLVQEEESSDTPNKLKISNLQARIELLRPNRFSEGVLLFGLRHQIVQSRFCE